MSQGTGSTAIPGLWPALAACLLDFEAYPGRYPLALREPRLLFEHGTEVLALASGRSVDGLPQDLALEAELRQAARFFVRTVMLRPGTDHYTLMGLTPSFDPARLRDHYRMLMRLTHPDFGGGGDRYWPLDAATRVNHANDVLSSKVDREDYDRVQGVVTEQPWRSVPTQAVVHPHLPRGVGYVPRPFSIVRRRALLSLVASGAVFVGMWALWGGREPEHARLSAVANETRIKLASRGSRPVVEEVESMAMPAQTAPARQAMVEPEQQEEGAAGSVVHPPVSGSARMTAGESWQRPAAPDESRLALRAVGAQTVREAAPASSAGAAAPLPEAAPMPSPLGTALLPVPPVAAVAPPPTPPTAVVIAVPGSAGNVGVGATAPMSASSTLGSATRLTMDDVQPLLGQILAAMQSGRGEQVLRWVERPSRRGDGADGFVQAFNRAVANASSVRVGAARFSGRPADDGMLVDGVVMLHLQVDSPQPTAQELVLQAQFTARGGQAVLTRLNAIEIAR